MTAIESKEEISDTDSGIILHSGKNNHIFIKNTLLYLLDLVIPSYVEL